jgi:hypothetical protein
LVCLPPAWSSFLCAGGGRCGSGVRDVTGWSALRDVATALMWPAASSESAVAWFGAHLCGHRTGVARMAISRITALTEALAPPTRVARGRDRRSRQTRAYRGLRVLHVAAQSGLSRDCDGLSRTTDAGRPQALRMPERHNANRWPRRPRTTGQRDETPTPLTPLGADRPRRNPDQRLSGTPERTRHPSVRNRPRPPRFQHPTTTVLGGPPPDPARGTTDARSSWCG